MFAMGTQKEDNTMFPYKMGNVYCKVVHPPAWRGMME
jgi:hypothetical protein